jgi:hypothetical protein
MQRALTCSPDEGSNNRFGLLDISGLAVRVTCNQRDVLRLYRGIKIV